MVYAVLTSLSLVCLAAGLTLLATSLGLSRRARRYHNGMQALLRLGGRGLEPLEIPPAAWPVLQAAGWGHLQLTGDWFGQPVDTEWGARSSLGPRPTSKKSLPLVIKLTSGDDVALVLTARRLDRRNAECEVVPAAAARCAAANKHTAPSLPRRRSAAPRQATQ